MFPKLARTVAVSVGSMILATLAVHATDMQAYSPRSLVAALFGVTQHAEAPCPEGMVLVTQAVSPFCVDRYEASAAPNCPFPEPSSADESELNLHDQTCAAVSEAHRRPWVHITQTDAQRACSRAGKRLLTSPEWYKAALGTFDSQEPPHAEGCNTARNIADGVAKGGSAIRCVSDAGAYDMIGNAWEWVDQTIEGGLFEDRVLPKTGYVAIADMSGMAARTESIPADLYGRDRFWSDSSVHAGVMRGGSFTNGFDAGVFAVYAASPPTFSGEGVGFRCAMTPHLAAEDAVVP